MKRNITLAVLLISLLAVGAYAQSETEPVKEQSRQDGSENAANPGDGAANQNYQEYENAKPGEAHDPSGPAGSTAQGDATQGDKALEADKSGESSPESTPVKEQTRQDGSENAANPGNGTANQNHQEYENAKPGEAHDPSGPAGSTAQGEAHQGQKEPVVNDKDGEMALDRNYGDSDGNNYEQGGTNRKGDDFTGEGGPHGPIGVLDGDKDGECDGDQTRERLYGDGEGGNHELGENHRRGGEFTGEGGPHGPMGTGPDADLLKIFGEDSDGSFAGELLRHMWGPGSSELDGPFGPNSDRAGFGPGGRDAVEGKSDPAASARGQARSGRR